MVNNLSIEIVALLLRGPAHPRAMAKVLDANHVTVLNRIAELEKCNALDYRTDGRNKVYFLKRTVEARNFAIMAEAHKLSKIVARYPAIRQIASGVQSDGRIGMALLFGSYAKGQPTKDSDIDLYVETEDLKLREDIRRLNSRLSVKIGAYDRTNLLIKEIEKDHVIIKGIEDYLERTGFSK